MKVYVVTLTEYHYDYENTFVHGVYDNLLAAEAVGENMEDAVTTSRVQEFEVSG